MRGFFKYVFATVVGIFTFFLLSLLILFIVFAIALPGETEIKENSVLKLNLDRRIVERETGNLISQISRPFAVQSGTIGLLELRMAIKAAMANENIKGIYLNVSNLNVGMAMLDELRSELQNFKKSGKFVVAYADSYSEEAYYLSSVADKIYLPPSGLLEFNGLNVEVLFFKKLLDRLEIKPEVFKVGEYKSAVEPFITEEMSVANREQLRTMLSSIYSHMLQNIADSRKIETEKLRVISDSMLIRDAEDALKFNLITDLDYLPALEAFVKDKLGLESDDKINYVEYFDLIERENKELSKISANNKIAVVYAVGDIMDGKGDERTIGSETLSEELRMAREDSTIKAVVLRINSPGGSALASDIIWNEVKLTAEVKPVIASMSDLAASGGYYIAAGCDTIVAQPSTITGSIGVFGVLFNGKEFLNDKLGITTDKEQTGPYSDIGSFTRGLSREERKIIQQEIEEIYIRFVNIVANGRSLSTDQVKAIAEGRVWSGLNAEDIKLVDIKAGLDEAVKIAASKANIKEYDVIYLPEAQNLFFRRFVAQMKSGIMEDLLKSEAGDLYPYLDKIRSVKRLEGIQTRLPFEMVLE